MTMFNFSFLFSRDRKACRELGRTGSTGMRIILLSIIVLLATSTINAQAQSTPPGAIVLSEFIFNEAPFPACHASTIAQTPQGLAAAWFGGTREGDPDVCIWVSRYRDHKWSPVNRVADGVQKVGNRLPCWNPVLFQPRGGPLLLFYKVGSSPSKWWGMMTISPDEGANWFAPRRLPNGILGPIKDKPIQLADGMLLNPSSTEDDGWHIHVEFTRDLGQTWTKTGSLNSGPDLRLNQPTILNHGNGQLQILCRSGEGKIYESWSADDGKKWSKPAATALPNPNSGIDAVQLRDGRSLLVYNDSSKDRRSLNIAISQDGRSWKMAFPVENSQQELSYPAVIQSEDGLVHITYTWNRRKIRHVVLDPAAIQ
jgi:predicted neuraminidase